MKTAVISQEGEGQVVHLPKEFRFKEDRVYIKRMGNAIVLIPYTSSWDTLLKSLDQFLEDFMDERAQPPMQERRDTFI